MLLEESVTSLRVRPNDLDILGHVNNATVLEYFEAGRWDWMDQHGLRRNTRVLPVVSRIEVDYRRELRLQDMEVHTALEPLEGEDLEDEEALRYRVFFRQKILVDGGKHVAAEARVQVAFIDGATRALSTFHEFLAACRAPKD